MSFHPINEIYTRNDLRENCIYEGPGVKPYVVKCGLLHIRTKKGLKRVMENNRHKHSTYLRVK